MVKQSVCGVKFSPVVYPGVSEATEEKAAECAIPGTMSGGPEGKGDARNGPL